MNATVPEILRAAADLIEPEGAWTQGRLNIFRNGQPVCWCAMGAIIHASGGCGRDAVSLIEADLPRSPSTEPLRPIAKWNDAPERTQAEVVAKLREAADLAERTAGGAA